MAVSRIAPYSVCCYQVKNTMMTTPFARFMHLNTTRLAVAASKSNLAKLRKKTGYPFANCKKALENNNDDLEKAEKWLEEQAKALGWSKAMKMESRNTPQGLVGIAWDSQYAAMVEVNCETDFVSKNDKFQKLVDLVAKTCLHHVKAEKPSPKSISKVILEGEHVGKLMAQDEQSLSDHVIKGIAIIGEKMMLRRAALVSVEPNLHLSALTHPSAPSDQGTMMGKYGAILAYTAATHSDQTAHLAKQLCQHIIGMNPTKIEASPEDPAPKKTVAKEQPVVEGQGGDEPVELNTEDEETVMMRQTFLLDSERTVADVLAEAEVKVEDFVRFECGEGMSEPEETTAKVAQAAG